MVPPCRTSLGFLPLLSWTLVGLASFGCSPAVGSNRIEDLARRDVPIAICHRNVDPNERIDGALTAEGYWKTVVPSFEGFAAGLPSTARDCAGNTPFQHPKDGLSVPLAIASNSVSLVRGEDGLFLAWLRTKGPKDGNEKGLLALGRLRPTEIDIYSLGTYEGLARKTAFGFARMGASPVIVAQDQGCAGARPGAECTSLLRLLLPQGARLQQVLEVPLERVEYAHHRDLGRVKWRLSVDPPLFAAKTVTLRETVSGRDNRDDEIRKLEGKRVFEWRHGELITKDESLWNQVGLR